jgi:hypothetical protein
MGVLDSVGGFIKDAGHSIANAAESGVEAAGNAFDTAVEDAKAAVHAVGNVVREVDAAKEKVGAWIDQKEQQLEHKVDDGRAWLREHGGVVGKVASDQIGLVEGVGTSLYGAGKGIVQLADGVSQLANPLEWAANPDANIARLKSGAQTVETLGKIANLAQPTSWIADPKGNAQLAGALWHSASTSFNEDPAKFIGNAVGTVGTFFIPGGGEAAVAGDVGRAAAVMNDVGKAAAVTADVGKAAAVTADVGKAAAVTADVGKAAAVTADVGKAAAVTADVGKATAVTEDVGKAAAVTEDVGKAAAVSEDTGKAATVTGDASKAGVENPSRIIRQDNDFAAVQNSKGVPKSHLEDGAMVPANPNGKATPLQHVIGSMPAKGDSPFTSFLTEEGGVAKSYGSQEVELDLARLKTDIASGKLPNVEVVSPQELQAAIKAEIKSIAPGVDPQAAIAKGPAGIDDYVASQGLSRGKSDQLARRLLALSNSERDGECLVKGIIPKEYLKGPNPTR